MTRKTKPTSTKKYSVNIVVDTKTCITRYADPDERWDADDLSHNNNILGFVVTDNEWGDFYFEEEPDFNTALFLVYVTYRTGDSFHHETGVIEKIALLEDPVDAKALVNYIENDCQRVTYHTVVFKCPSGKKVEFYTAWVGYFETFTDVDYVALRRLK